MILKKYLICRGVMITRNYAFEAPGTGGHYYCSQLASLEKVTDVPFAWKLYLLFLFLAKCCSLESVSNQT